MTFHRLFKIVNLISEMHYYCVKILIKFQRICFRFWNNDFETTQIMTKLLCQFIVLILKISLPVYISKYEIYGICHRRAINE